MKNYIAFVICFSTVYCILANTQLERKSSSKMEFGAKCSSSYPTDIYASAYLIRKSDGKIMSGTYGSDKLSVSYSISKTEYIDESTEKYYCRAVGTYQTIYGNKTTFQETTSKY